MNHSDELDLQALVTSLPVAAFVCGLNGQVRCYNDYAEQLWGAFPGVADPESRYWGLHPISIVGCSPLIDSESLLDAALKTGRDQHGEVTFRSTSGRVATVLLDIRPILDPQGNVVGAINLFADVSAQKQIEGELQRVSQFRESIIRTAAEGICVCYPLAEFPFIRFTVWNDRMLEITGYSVDEINRVGWYQAMYPDPELQSRAIARMMRMRDGDDLRNEEWMITSKTGQERMVAISTSIVTLDENGPAVVAMIQDVTHQHRVQNALLESEQRLKLVIDASKLGPWDWDLRTDQAYLSPEWKQQLGYDDDELENRFEEWEKRLHPADKAFVLQRLQDYLHGKISDYDLEFRLLHKDHSYRWIYTRGLIFRDGTGTPTRMLGCHLDITRLKHAEDTLRHVLRSVGSVTGQEYFGTLASFLCEVCKVDLALVAELGEGDLHHARTVTVSHAGRVAENFSFDLNGSPCAQLWDRKNPSLVQRTDTFEFADSGFLRDIGVRSMMAIPLWTSAGQPIGFVALMHSSTIEDVEHAESILQVVGSRSGAEMERHRTEKALRASEQRLASIASTVPQALYVFNVQKFETEYQNRLVAADLGYSESEMAELGHEMLFTLLHPDDRDEMPALLARWENAMDGQVFETEYRMRHQSGKWLWFLGRDTVYERDADGKVRTIIGTSQEITHRVNAERERIELESKIQHGQKLESLGILAGGIAHDFNNLLTSILGFADLALMSLPADSLAANYVLEAVKGAKNAAELTGQMLAYSGKGKFVMQRVDLSTVVSETSRLLEVSVSKKSDLRLQLMEHLPKCDGDISQLRQVIMNLIINASEAIGEHGGVINVSTGTIWLTAHSQIRDGDGNDLPAGDYVYLEVADNGCGMDAETRRKLFDPFFSTKFSGRGLGMSAVLGIVRGHHGAIQVDTEINRGTTFRILLPVSQSLDSVSEPLIDMPASPWQGQGKVLIADDESIVLTSTALLVQCLGFEVVTAKDGCAAVDLFRSLSEDIRLVLLDLTMPQMDGTDACQAIREIRGDVPVILMSGYNEEVASQRFANCGSSGFLQKPFRIDLLKEMIERVLADVDSLLERN